MASSKLVRAIDKATEVAVSAYKAVESAVVGSYTKIEDKFVERYLMREGESVREAKARLKSESK